MMEDTTLNTNAQGSQSQSQMQSAAEDNARVLEEKFKETPATEEAVSVTLDTPAQEHRQAYGTAKTENLRDSGLWRVLLPAF
ncbi:MAG TPA: hypothetical protein VFQ30_12630, partial [Ktedonobacteraceae bacterium]|nr:hypothetical protein [Ktedonobacteraceae bacterium]